MANRENPPGSQSTASKKSGKRPEIVDNSGASHQARFIRVRDADAYFAAYDLFENFPLCSAATGLTPIQKIVLIFAMVCIVVTGWFNLSMMISFFHGLLLVVFGFAICFRTLLLIVHFWPKPNDGARAPDNTHRQILPTYTLLLPLYHEAKILPKLVAAIEQFEYPTARLDIKLLLEADDLDTLEAVKKLQLGQHWEILIVPDIGPRTKPKALNIGLARAKGSFVTIYDAEDRPHPNQLLAAIQAFAKGPNNLACVQAPLGYYNAKQNWITRQFALEYNAQFRVILPALVRLGIAFPLGGTSNHFRRTALADTRGWDPFNVTEDADLGFRLAQNGWCSGVISPPTLEEATASIRPWVGQRSRWIKGFLQTFIVHMRGGLPGGCLQHAVGFFSILGLAIISAFTHAFLLLGAIFYLIYWGFGGPALSSIAITMAGVGTVLAWVLLATGNIAAQERESPFVLVSSCAYWPLQTWAALRAAWEILHKPFHWEKTDHGHSLD